MAKRIGGFKRKESPQQLIAVGCVGCKFDPMCPKTYNCADPISRAEAMSKEEKPVRQMTSPIPRLEAL